MAKVADRAVVRVAEIAAIKDRAAAIPVKADAVNSRAGARIKAKKPAACPAARKIAND